MFAKHARQFTRAKPDVIFYIDSPEISQREAAQSNIPGESSLSALAWFSLSQLSVSPLPSLVFPGLLETSQTTTSLLSSRYPHDD